MIPSYVHKRVLFFFGKATLYETAVFLGDYMGPTTWSLLENTRAMGAAMSSSLISHLTDKSDQRPQSGIYALVNTSAQHRVVIRALGAEVSEERKRFSKQREIFESRISHLKELLVAIDIQERLLPKTLPGWPLRNEEA